MTETTPFSQQENYGTKIWIVGFHLFTSHPYLVCLFLEEAVNKSAG